MTALQCFLQLRPQLQPKAAGGTATALRGLRADEPVLCQEDVGAAAPLGQHPFILPAGSRFGRPTVPSREPQSYFRCHRSCSENGHGPTPRAKDSSHDLPVFTGRHATGLPVKKDLHVKEALSRARVPRPTAVPFTGEHMQDTRALTVSVLTSPVKSPRVA